MKKDGNIILKVRFPLLMKHSEKRKKLEDKL